MKTLHRYLLRQVFTSLLMTVAVFTFVLLLGNVLRDILTLLVNRQASLGTVLEAVGLLLQYVAPFALPMGMLTATLLVFGRFSADQELTAARASGVSLVSLTTPILLLSLGLCAVSGYANLELAPRSRMAYKELLFRVGEQMSNLVLPEGQRVNIGDYVFFVSRNRYPDLHGVTVLQMDTNQNSVLRIDAPRGRMSRDAAGQKLTIELFDAVALRREQGGWLPAGYSKTVIQEFDLDPDRKVMRKPKLGNMSFRELRAEQRAWEQMGMNPAPVLVQLHTRVAFAFACFGFTLVGIPLGIRVHRRETNVGVALALVLVAVYYSFLLLGRSLSQQPAGMPYLAVAIVWLPNFLFQSMGALLLWRANRGL